MAGALQGMDPLHTAYLDWHHVVRNLIAQAAPSLIAITAAQLLQLKQSLQQADSNADGFLTDSELMGVDLEPVLSGSASVNTANAQDDMTGSSAAEAAGDGAAAIPQDGNGKLEQQALQDQGMMSSPDENEGAAEPATAANAVAQLKQMLFKMFASNASGDAAVSIEEILLYFCCDSDATAGLSKAFVVVIGGQTNEQVCSS